MFSTPPASLHTQILHVHSYTPPITTANRRYVTLLDDAISPDVSCEPQQLNYDHVILLHVLLWIEPLSWVTQLPIASKHENSPSSSLTMISVTASWKSFRIWPVCDRIEFYQVTGIATIGTILENVYSIAICNPIKNDQLRFFSM